MWRETLIIECHPAACAAARASGLGVYGRSAGRLLVFTIAGYAHTYAS